jgi:hypothetical protein
MYLITKTTTLTLQGAQMGAGIPQNNIWHKSNTITSKPLLPYFRNVFNYYLWNAGPSGLGGLRRRSTAARLLRSWVRILSVAWMFVCCECCLLSGRGLCDELINRPRRVLPTVARHFVWSRNLVWRDGHEKRAEPLVNACSKNSI